ncbi:hypothetical protein AKJ43_01915 [candidate division MSBL1 archaeon SCGC-AAA261D19]|uniref:Uncharacterized protein n=1 Tax=candidate division MSBL1 archaeon SCGC-AAA261D19 TaxID=1698273 RepID=A0A133V7G4_9EURY|nr:hypothetical protein AKJ43_01915 [candidate division MSBL1 archaeon SCGC-AAA261D19]
MDWIEIRRVSFFPFLLSSTKKRSRKYGSKKDALAVVFLSIALCLMITPIHQAKANQNQIGNGHADIKAVINHDIHSPLIFIPVEGNSITYELTFVNEENVTLKNTTIVVNFSPPKRSYDSWTVGVDNWKPGAEIRRSKSYLLGYAGTYSLSLYGITHTQRHPEGVDLRINGMKTPNVSFHSFHTFSWMAIGTILVAIVTLFGIVLKLMKSR